MRVFFLNPPFLPNFSREQRSPAVTKSGTFYYPMWLCYAAGLLEQSGFEVKVLDAPARRLDGRQVLEIVREFSPELTVVDTSTPSLFNDIDVAAKIKEATGSFTLLVGTHPSALPQETLMAHESIDAVARREYEHTVLALAVCLDKKRTGIEDLKGVDGMSFRKDGRIFHNKDRPLIEDLDSFPFVSEVYKKHLHYKDYFYAHSRHPIVTLITARGCPFQCVYCLYPQTFNSRKVRYRSVERVVDEIEYCLKNFPDLKEIMFEDDTFTVNKKRAAALAEEILKRGLRFKWSANSRADVDFETMQVLKKAGARLFCVGIESGDQRVLDAMKKGLSVEQVRRFFKDARRAGLLVHGCFLVGNPGETKETLQKTLEFALELNPDTAQFFPIMIYPGTEAYQWATERGYLTTSDFRQWLTPQGLHNCVVSRPGLSNHELVEFCDRARQRFYTRPSYIARKIIQGFSDPREMKRLFKGGITLSRYILQGSFRRDKCKECR